ncbi:MAG: IS630 family transposase [Bryobacteraceae bacterium]
MQVTDGRTLGGQALHERHRQIVRAFKRGHNKMAISRDLGVSYSAVCRVIWRYEREGAGTLAPRRKGRRKGSGRYLSEEQEAHIRRLICEKRPEQMKMDFALWSRAAVLALIADECGITLSIRAVGTYLRRWGFTPQKPIKRAYEQSAPAVKAWLEETYPSIAQRAKAERAEIHWGDETGVVNTDVRGRGYAPKGQTPIAKAVGGTREKLSMISTVTNQGKTRWMIIDGAFNGDRLIEFFEALIKDAPRKVFIILDNLGVHHCKPVKAWLKAHAEHIEAFYLPSYSPELNPDERLNAGLKQALGTRVALRTKAKLKAATEQHMLNLERQPERVRAYFGDPRVKYAA